MTAAALVLTGGCVFSSRASRPNVLLVSIDTLRADRLGAYGYFRETSPFIDSLAARGVVFDRVIVPLPATDPSHGSMLSGLHPFRTGVTTNGLTLNPDVETLPMVFRKAGYHTIGATAVYSLGRAYGFARGFDDLSETSPGKVTRNADQIDDDVFHLIAGHAERHADEPLFLMVHYFDVHAPYVDRANIPESPPNEKASPVSLAYDSGVRFVDDHLRLLWNTLDRFGLTKNMLVIVTADHGEQLGEHGFSGGHADIYWETIRVPLIIAGPGIGPRRISTAISSMDLAPTILGLVGLKFTKPTDGMTVAPLLRGAVPGSLADRSFLVVGYPSFTRSIGLWTNGTYYIHNFDHVYMQMAVDSQVAKAAVSWRAAPSLVVGKSRIFSIPALDFTPYEVDVTVAPRAGCPLDLSITTPPGLALASHVAVKAPIRIRYPVARLDRTFINTRPGDCVASLAWTFRRMSGPQDFAMGHSWTTVLFKGLLAPRKTGDGDEMYDITVDPDMLDNVISDASASAISKMVMLEQLAFQEYSPTRQSDPSLPSEEIDRLRALGYVQ
jgi:arylsulfatase A-like enzyme